jgi:hypothetical protein
MKKRDIIKEVYSEKQRKWTCWQSNLTSKKRKKGLSKKEAEEMCSDVDHSLKQEESTNPKMKKGELMEYINFKKNGGVKKLRKKDIVKEARSRRTGDIHIIEEMDNHDRRDVMRYLEYIRESGIINMFGAHPILNWTKKDLHRWLYGQKLDPEYVEEQIEDLKNDYEDDNESEIDSLEEQLRILNYLLDNKQKIRDILVRTALRRIENQDGDMETSNVQRVFEKLAKESWKMWTTGIYGL